MNLSREHFIPNLPHDEARALFKDSIEIIPISISRHCNRKCDYCPDSFVDRFSVHDVMGDALFETIITQLAEIDYSRLVAINRYNEPLADVEYALSRIKEIRAALPSAKIEVSTNGDFLDHDVVLSLRDAGVTNLVTTCHAQPGVHNFPHLRGLLQARIEKLGFPIITVQGTSNWMHVEIDAGPGMDFFYRSFDADSRNSDGSLSAVNDRGGSLPVKNIYERVAPCFRQFKAFEIEWDGSLWPCCQIHNDVPAHMNYCLGKLTPQSDIFVAWTSLEYVAWRKEMFAYGHKKMPCTNCNFMVLDGMEHTIENARLVARAREEWALG